MIFWILNQNLLIKDNTMNNAKEVSLAIFYNSIGTLDAIVSIEGKYPFKTVFTTRTGKVLGFILNGETNEKHKYFLPY